MRMPTMPPVNFSAMVAPCRRTSFSASVASAK